MLLRVNLIYKKTTSQDESRSKSPLQPDVLRMERNFMGVVAPDVTENEKIGSETRADDINTMSLIGKIRERLPVNSDWRN